MKNMMMIIFGSVLLLSSCTQKVAEEAVVADSTAVEVAVPVVAEPVAVDTVK